jgi:K+ transporter
MMVTVKYTLIILCADNEGEGGTFSTYSLLFRYVSTYYSADYLSSNLAFRHTPQNVILERHL